MDRADRAPNDQTQMYRLLRPIVLVGMMGSGKTAIGKTLAARIGVPFLDSDTEIERAANATIAEVFARDGEPFFRAREVEVIARLMQGNPAILSTGGGAFLAEQTRKTIARLGVSLWLDVDVDVLWDRVRHKNTRPLLRTADPKGTLTTLSAERTPIYRQSALSIKVGRGFSIAETTELAIQTLLNHPTTLEPVE